MTGLRPSPPPGAVAARRGSPRALGRLAA